MSQSAAIESHSGPEASSEEGASLNLKNDIIPTNLAIRAMRDSGYRNTAFALAELIDNAAQAKATDVEVFCIEQFETITVRSRRRMKAVAVLDNGAGMTAEVLRIALQFGNGTHLQDRTGIGRFGMGLPNASISQSRRVDVWTWQSGPDNALHSYLDIDEIEDQRLRVVPLPQASAVPAEWRARGSVFDSTGTLVVWTKLDEERLTWKTGKSTLENTETLIGRIYRKFIDRGDLRIQLKAMEVDGVVSYDQTVRANDPLYLMAQSSTPDPFDKKAMFQRYGEKDQKFEVEYNGTMHAVVVRASYALPETLPDDGTDRGRTPYGKHAAKNIGVSIVRADRELELDSTWANSDPTERWWGVEVDFPPALDEVFGVTNNKQAATLFSHLVNFNWESEAEKGESFLHFKHRLADEGDPRSKLIDIVSHIRTVISSLRSALETQTRGRRTTSGKRHEETSTADLATAGFKQRAKEGHVSEGDNVVFDENAEVVVKDDLVRNKKYTPEAAQGIIDAIKQKNRKVQFIEVENEMDAFFSVELTKAGGITEIIFNKNHKAYRLLIEALNAKTEGCTDKELIRRIENATEALDMLFASWARMEIEDMPNRDRNRRLRQDWGRMANDFLSLGFDSEGGPQP